MKVVATMIALIINFCAHSQSLSPRNWIDSQMYYTDVSGNAFSITHSLPKGGGTYTDTTGITYSYVVFWYCITNTAQVPLEVALQFPVTKYQIFNSKESHIRIVLPSETMTADKIELFDYGLANLKDYLDSEFNNSSTLDITIPPNKDYYFYSSVLMHQVNGSARAAFILEDQKLVYEIKIGENANLVSCGKIRFYE